MILRFTPIDKQELGILSALLMRSYAVLVESDSRHWEPEKAKWIAFDREAFGNPRTLGGCVFLSWHEKNPVGFGSFDPQQRPALGSVGHNCILPEHRGKGFGKQQMLEILRRMADQGIRTARATTHDHPFFLPARRMYEACGFRKAGREPWTGDPQWNLIHYEMQIK